MSKLPELGINTIRTLSMDAVERANSGHPGTAMALAPAMYALWQHDLNYDPADPLWPARDRFVLSVGHASMLLYSTIFLTGIRDIQDGKVVDRPALTVEDLTQFRQLDSRTPGHPEYRFTAGVETTTGPLGQGCGNSVGMAMAEKWLAARYNRPGFQLFDYHVTVFCGDGDMMEGVASEAASTAGHLGLGNLTWVYDSNQISIEGSTDLALTENVGKRFEAYGWHVQTLTDGNDVEAILGALRAAKAVTDRPSLIVLKTVIGYGAPKKAGTASAHGEPLGGEEIKGAKAAYGWPADAPAFFVPEGVSEHFAEGIGKRGAAASAQWRELFSAYRDAHPELAAELDCIFENRLPADWDKDIPVFPADAKGIASRQSSGQVLNAVAKNLPWMIGGSADLTPSTKTDIKGGGSFQPERWGGTYGGRNIHFGVREHAMGSICNGIALAGLRAYGSGFLIFSDYMKAPIRLSAIMELPVLYVFTHDSIGVGEDGPTHQPIEQLAQLRATPGIMTIRPSDANEVAEAWRVLVPLTHKPAVLVLSRQNLPTIDRTKYAPVSGLARGAYVLASCEGKPDVILMASGSEVSLVVDAYEKLTAEGIKARVVSFPSFDLFEEQDQAYRDSVLPPDVIGRVAVEQAAAFGWDRYVGLGGSIIAMNSFGASAPLAALLTKFGFTPEAVYGAAKQQASRGK
ncbi:transketolase [Gluconobacter wancherniae]|uniref:Transketolase n=1 Tax=Gluconobacter wancherniae NBRC 103581 TaxID=656744 RepID=A0A511AWJ1_9PROT|nr:transketolase [Gluconobacter wancherniae]MBF0852757.1 transketolase [Gluconobacter wancherniae]MBS1087644.1 transketolase [Gluconobacter wancherniae]MBS1093327.1 transketolase [Gluconobacter wancherniae]GBD56529.1 transketolase [Gluconobacter wancherniae NBRC 103581]GBR64048.1 transketolase [Gluconobacter wancherniae NBRC 103581]